jgi:hypothetical protein
MNWRYLCFLFVSSASWNMSTQSLQAIYRVQDNSMPQNEDSSFVPDDSYPTETIPLLQITFFILSPQLVSSHVIKPCSSLSPPNFSTSWYRFHKYNHRCWNRKTWKSWKLYALPALALILCIRPYTIPTKMQVWPTKNQLSWPPSRMITLSIWLTTLLLMTVNFVILRLEMNRFWAFSGKLLKLRCRWASFLFWSFLCGVYILDWPAWRVRN